MIERESRSLRAVRRNWTASNSGQASARLCARQRMAVSSSREVRDPPFSIDAVTGGKRSRDGTTVRSWDENAREVAGE